MCVCVCVFVCIKNLTLAQTLYFTTKKPILRKTYRVLARFSVPVQTGPGNHPASCTMLLNYYTNYCTCIKCIKFTH